MPTPPHHHGFSLVELSIVLVILGLLVGGVMTGQNLIRAAELRSVSSELQQYQTATNIFRARYFYLPGDMPNATAFWQDEGNCAAVESNTHLDALSGGTCNGLGNGRVRWNGSSWAHHESFLFWHHLQMAGLISGQYTGVRGEDYNYSTIIGENVPRAKVSDGGWSVNSSTGGAGCSNCFAQDFINTFVFGGQAGSGAWTYGGILTPEEAWNIDTKMDDGRPGRGIIIAYSYNSCADASSDTEFDANYQLSENSKRCALFFRNAMQ